jgi:ankyrin repeat protein
MADLIDSSREGNLERVVEMLKAGANVHAKDDEALWWASANGHLKVVKLLLDYGANKNGLHEDATPEMRGYIPVNQRRAWVCGKLKDIPRLTDFLHKHIIHPPRTLEWMI